MAQRPPKKSRRRITGRVLLVLLCLLVVFIVLDFDWTGRGAPPPTEVLRYDGHEWVVVTDEFLRSRGVDVPDLPADQNAALDYLAASKTLPRLPADKEQRDVLLDELYYVVDYEPSDDCQLLWSYLDGARRAFRRASQGLDKERTKWSLAPPYDSDARLLGEMSFPWLADMRRLGRLFVCRGRRATMDGEGPKALDSFLAPVQIGSHLARGPSTLHGLVGVAVSDMGLRALSRWILSDPPPALLRQALERVRELQRQRPDFLHSLCCHRAVAHDFVRTFGKYRVESERDLLSVTGPLFGRSRTVRGIVHRKLNTAYGRIEEWSKLEGRPKYEALAALPDEIRNEAEHDWYIELFAYSLWSQFHYHRRFVLNELRYAAIQIRIGLALYKAEHGRYPGSLAALEPYLGDVPCDIVTGEPFHYRLEGDGYVFYSVGPNLQDDGGLDQRVDKTKIPDLRWGEPLFRPIGQAAVPTAGDDLVFPSHLAPAPPLEEYLKHDGRRPGGGWSTERHAGE